MAVDSEPASLLEVGTTRETESWELDLERSFLVSRWTNPDFDQPALSLISSSSSGSGRRVDFQSILSHLGGELVFKYHCKVILTYQLGTLCLCDES